MSTVSGGRDVAVIGAGSVGISSAIHLQQRGWRVTLIDRGEPASQTSFGNAGVINAGSMVPLNNPDLHRSLLSLLRNDKAALRYRPSHVLERLGWSLAFLEASKTRRARAGSLALHALTSRALEEHRALMQRTGNGHRLTENGWLKVFRREGDGKRSAAAAALAGFTGELLRECGVTVRPLDRDAVRALEPSLKPIFASGFHLVEGGVVDDPGQLLREHADRFIADGGEWLQGEIHALGEDDRGAWLRHGDGERRFSRVLVAAGPWSGDVLASAGFRTELNVERGYHTHVSLDDGVRLAHSVHDVDAGYVMGPVGDGVRVTTGVELAARDAPSDLSQLDQVMPRVAEAIAVTRRSEEPPWRGARPTFPDSCPAIGALPGSERLWANFGHQHIGLMTGPITGRLVAEMMSGETPEIDPTPFRCGRWIRRQRADHGGRFRGRRLGAR